MPRGATVNLVSNTEKSKKNESDHTVEQNDVGGAIKTEFDGPGEQVIHRKSARRRVARDIFLVFEEQSRRRQGNGCNRKGNQVKSKFGHLKVENLNASSRAVRRSKKEPNQNDANLNRLPKQLVERKKNAVGVKKSGEKIHKNLEALKTKSSSTVNPIFLWAKQDDTRIVEVRCEDYDKRNRIRIKKTTTGWRAIPRSDASTSRIVKFFQTPSSLMKLKREINDSNLLKQSNECAVIGELSENSSIEAINLNENQAIHIDEKTKSKKTRCQLDSETAQNNNHNQSEDLIFRNCVENRDDITALSAIDTGIVTSTEMVSEPECTTSIDRYSDQLSENESQNSQSCCTNDEAKVCENVTTNSADTYQTSSSDLRLCPRTGLFFSNESKNSNSESNEVEANDSGIHVDMHTDSGNVVDSVIESRNIEDTDLKSLLAETDLLQHCNDNTNTDLIDSLVNQGCENALMSHEDLLRNIKCAVNNSFQKETETTSTSIISPKDSIDEGIVDNMLPQLTDLCDSHQCLSFNAVGEIEEENGVLYPSLPQFSNALQTENNVKNTNTLNPKAIETINMPLSIATSLSQDGALSLKLNATVDSTLKDLNYSNIKPETICEHTESHSQCANVTSSSDILHSAGSNDDDVPIRSGTENIKNFILEKFINLNALNLLPNTNTTTTTSKMQQQQYEEEDVVDQQQTEKEGEVVTKLSGPISEIIETFIIDDDCSNDEPAKKKICNKINKNNFPNLPPTAISDALSTNKDIDEDPDPLTQLQLLLRNTQWKVPDPILVPKDRLRAVLASPAREIPLLITTRPELRLPEAFAYPHIIQNPNILVISMAQLEAILKNHMDIEKTALFRKANDDVVCPSKNNISMATKPSKPKDLNRKCSSGVENNSMTTDFNTATLAVINQMLRLPYIGQWSQELLSNIKNPIDIQNQFTNFLSSYYHHFAPYGGLQHRDDLYKTNVKQLSNSMLKEQQNISEPDTFQTSPLYLRAISSIQNQVDFMLLQKLAQQQMSDFLTSNEPSSSFSSADSSLSSSKSERESLHNIPKCTSNSLQKQQLPHNPKCNNDLLGLCSADYSHNEDTLNINFKNINNSAHLKKIGDIQQKQNTKPRLTCKSLSNLLEPENGKLRTLPLPFPKVMERGLDSTNNYANNCIMQQSFSGYPNVTFKQADFHTDPAEKRRHCNKNLEQTKCIQEKSSSDIGHLQGNNSQIQTLFNNSDGHGSYSSQWNWTTVTATGE